MKLIFVTNIYKEEEKKEIERVTKEIKALGFDDYKIYVNDGIKDNRGYAYGVNQGIKKGLKEGGELFVVFNADISMKGLTRQLIIDGLTNFDILGFSVKQDNKTYYGGEIDKWRMSGGLLEEKPKQRYSQVDFVSGSLMFIKRSVVEKIGLWDESYFFYYDEVDYCQRAKMAGFKLGIDSRSSYQHFELSVTNPRKEYFLAKNRLKFFWRYSNSFQKVRELMRLPKTLVEYFPLFFSMVKQSKFLTNFLSLNISSLLNKLFHFGLFIFLVRNLSPAQYGIYTIVWAFIGVFNPFIDLGTTSYGLVYLPKDKELMVNRLISMRFFIGLIIFSLVNIVAWSVFYSQREIFYYVFLTSASILSGAWSGSYLIVNSIREKVINSSIVSLIFNIFFVLTIVFGLLFKQQLSIVFQTVFLLFVGYGLINFFLVKKELTKLKITFDWISWKKIIGKSYIFVIIGFLAGFYFKQDVFLLKFLQSESTVGIYTSGYKFLDAFLLIAASYNIIATPIFSRIHKEKHLLRKKILKDFLLLFFIGSVIAFLFYLVSPLILPLILKGSYVDGIDVARIVVMTLPFILISSIFFNVLYVFDLAKYVLLILLVQVFLNFILNLIFIPVYSYYASAWITVLSEILNMSMAYYFVRKRL